MVTEGHLGGGKWSRRAEMVSRDHVGGRKWSRSPVTIWGGGGADHGEASRDHVGGRKWSRRGFS